MTPPDLDRIAYALLTPVADSAWRALVLAILIGAAIAMLRRRAAAVRLSAWTLVLYAALALPLVSLVLPAWQWSVPSVRALVEWWPAAPTPLPPHVASSSVITGPTTVGASVAPAGAAFPVIAAAVYLAGLLLLALHTCVGWLATRRLRLSARTIADPDALTALGRHAGAAGLSAPPRLVESGQLSVPVTMSVVHPIVALPDDWRDWPAERLDAVLAHEVAHVARRDALTQRLSLGYRAILWFSPLSWWLHRHLSDLAEQASDEAALQRGIDPAVYAGTLLDFFARLQNEPRRAEWHVAMARSADADAERRVERILSWKGGPVMTRSKWLLAGMLIVTVPMVALTASVRPTPRSTPPAVGPAAVPAQPGEVPMTPVVAQAPAIEPAARVGGSKVQPVRHAAVQQPAGPAAPGARPAGEPIQAPPAQQSSGQTVPPPPDDFAKGAYEGDAPGVVAPQAIRTVLPKYSAEAMRAKLQGTAVVEIIVSTEGTVSKARIKDSLDPVLGLDEQAIVAARQWIFVPGTFNGQVVPTHVLLSLQFRIH